MRFALFNRLPSSNATIVSQDLVVLLFKIRTGVLVNLALLIMEQITSFRMGKKNGFRLIFPQLINKILATQKEVLLPCEFAELPSPGLTFRPPEWREASKKKDSGSA